MALATRACQRPPDAQAFGFRGMAGGEGVNSSRLGFVGSSFGVKPAGSTRQARPCQQPEISNAERSGIE